MSGPFENTTCNEEVNDSNNAKEHGEESKTLQK